MNQILFTESSTEKNTKKRNKGPADIKKVTIFFVVAIIIFAIVLIGQGVFSLLTLLL